MGQQRVLFLCTQNSARSQMAEGLLRARGGSRYEAFSAGTEATKVRPEALQVMAELGIDISDQRSKRIDRYLGDAFDWVITVCDRARESCPVFPGATQSLHWDFDDPAAVDGADADRLAAFRRIRDEIDREIQAFVAAG